MPEYDPTAPQVFRWDFHFLGLDLFIEVDCDSRIGRFFERRGF